MKMRRIKTWVILTLISIIFIAIILRLIKLYDFALWGSDSGEHYYLMEQLIKTGQINLDYNGWGFAYPYFPGMHLVTAGVVETSGISPYYVLLFVIPIIGALSVILVFLISCRVFRDPRIGLVAAGFLAVVMPHVFSSSHPIPGSLGAFLLLTCILSLLKAYEKRAFIIPLGISTITLVLTHHMSTYFLIISIISIILFREFLTPKKIKELGWIDRTKFDIGYLTFLLTISLLFWLVYAPPFYERILSKGIQVPSWGLIIIAYVGVGILWLIVYLRRKLRWEFKLRFLSIKNLILRILIFNIFGLIVLELAVITTVPGTNMQTDIISLPLFIPIVILMSFLSIAPAFLLHYKDGIVIFAWMFAILVSIIFAFITNSQELLLYRHLPYIFEPITILAGLGIVKLFDSWQCGTDTRSVLFEPNNELLNKKPRLDIPLEGSLAIPNYTRQNTPSSQLHINLFAAGSVSILIIICGIFSYPPLEVLSGFEEGTTQTEFDSCFWVRDKIPDGATIASDHRMSSMIFGFSNKNASWEYAPTTLHADSFSKAKSELDSIHIPAGNKRLDYILITTAMQKGVTLKQWENAEPMSKEAIEKFNFAPFIKLFDNGDVQIYYYIDSDKIYV